MIKVNQEERAGKAWDILISYAKEKQLISYKELANKIGIHHRPLRFALDKIHVYCDEMNYPPLSILAVNTKGKPGSGFTNSYPNSIEFGNKSVFEYNWQKVENPFAYALDGTREEDLIDEILTNPNSASEVWERVKVRGKAQSMFRQVLLKIYDHKCAICGTQVDVLMEASHIVPWSECSDMDKLNPQNGLLLCSNHHKLFDAGYIFINHDYKVELYPELDMSEKDIKFLRLVEGKSIHLPQKNEMKPSKEYLEMHMRKFLNNME